jgi:hypothetical protein
MPGPNEAGFEHEAIGVNYLGVMHCEGAAPVSDPGGLGVEAAGRVTAVGSGVSNIAIGERDAHILGGPSSYATGRLYRPSASFTSRRRSATTMRPPALLRATAHGCHKNKAECNCLGRPHAHELYLIIVNRFQYLRR